MIRVDYKLEDRLTCPYGTPSRPSSEWRGSLPSYSARDLSYEYDIDGSWSIPRRVYRFS